MCIQLQHEFSDVVILLHRDTTLNQTSTSLKMDKPSRKFYYAVGMSFTSTVLLMCGYTSSAEWVEINKWLVGMYSASNVANKLKHKVIYE